MTNRFLVVALSVFLLLTSCCGNSSNQTAGSQKDLSDKNAIATAILTVEEQAKLTPDMVLEMLKSGNQKYMEGMTIRDNSQRIKESASGQHPKAVVLSCLDSRVLVEDIFHQGIGDLFVARVAGNFINEDILGSLEYACKASGSKLIVVLGHEHCGAIKSAIDDVKLGNITAMLEKVKPAVANASEGFAGEKTSKNAEFVGAVCAHNINHAIEEIRAKSPILKEMEDKGEIKIVGGVYLLETGQVDFL